MTAEQRLRALTELLTAAEAQHREKLREYRARRATVRQDGTYDAFHVAEAGLASAADRVEDLRDQHEEAMADVQREWLREQAGEVPVPPTRFDAENDLPLDVVMNSRAAGGDEDAMRWVAGNLK